MKEQRVLYVPLERATKQPLDGATVFVADAQRVPMTTVVDRVGYPLGLGVTVVEVETGCYGTVIGCVRRTCGAPASRARMGRVSNTLPKPQPP